MSERPQPLACAAVRSSSSVTPRTTGPSSPTRSRRSERIGVRILPLVTQQLDALH